MWTSGRASMPGSEQLTPAACQGHRGPPAWRSPHVPTPPPLPGRGWEPARARASGPRLPGTHLMQWRGAGVQRFPAIVLGVGARLPPLASPGAVWHGGPQDQAVVENRGINPLGPCGAECPVLVSGPRGVGASASRPRGQHGASAHSESAASRQLGSPAHCVACQAVCRRHMAQG